MKSPFPGMDLFMEAFWVVGQILAFHRRNRGGHRRSRNGGRT